MAGIESIEGIKLAEVNEQKNLVRRPPSAKVVAKWVESAGAMDAVVEY